MLSEPKCKQTEEKEEDEGERNGNSFEKKLAKWH